MHWPCEAYGWVRRQWVGVWAAEGVLPHSHMQSHPVTVTLLSRQVPALPLLSPSPCAHPSPFTLLPPPSTHSPPPPSCGSPSGPPMRAWSTGWGGGPRGSGSCWGLPQVFVFVLLGAEGCWVWRIAPLHVNKEQGALLGFPAGLTSEKATQGVHVPKCSGPLSPEDWLPCARGQVGGPGLGAQGPGSCWQKPHPLLGPQRGSGF